MNVKTKYDNDSKRNISLNSSTRGIYGKDYKKKKEKECCLK
jgi:hypothetical protein